MPELPEVEVTRRGLIPYLIGKVITDVNIHNPELRWPIPSNLSNTLVGLTIKRIERRGKFLLLDCEKGWLIVHFGMSGSLRVLPNSIRPQKHDHFDLFFDKEVLRLRDPRRFGSILWQPQDVKQHPLLANLGPEPLSKNFNGESLYRRIRTRSAPIKQILMNNHIVVGIGNIYANESLFVAGIHPNTRANRISSKRCQTLTSAIKTILRSAIAAGGSSLRDFVHSDGGLGCFQQNYLVYSRAGHPCRTCDTPIKHVRQGQRSSFYCPVCQR